MSGSDEESAPLTPQRAPSASQQRLWLVGSRDAPTRRDTWFDLERDVLRTPFFIAFLVTHLALVSLGWGAWDESGVRTFVGIVFLLVALYVLAEFVYAGHTLLQRRWHLFRRTGVPFWHLIQLQFAILFALTCLAFDLELLDNQSFSNKLVPKSQPWFQFYDLLVLSFGTFSATGFPNARPLSRWATLWNVLALLARFVFIVLFVNVATYRINDELERRQEDKKPQRVSPFWRPRAVWWVSTTRRGRAFADGGPTPFTVVVVWQAIVLAAIAEGGDWRNDVNIRRAVGVLELLLGLYVAAEFVRLIHLLFHDRWRTFTKSIPFLSLLDIFVAWMAGLAALAFALQEVNGGSFVTVPDVPQNTNEVAWFRFFDYFVMSMNIFTTTLAIRVLPVDRWGLFWNLVVRTSHALWLLAVLNLGVRIVAKHTTWLKQQTKRELKLRIK